MTTARKLIIGALLSASGLLGVAAWMRDNSVAPRFDQAGEATFEDEVPCREGKSIDEFGERPMLQPCEDKAEPKPGDCHANVGNDKSVSVPCDEEAGG